MKKIFALFAFAMVAVALNAATPYKNLFVTAQVTPSGSGTVYLTVKPGEEGYVRSQSEDFGETASIQATIGENGTEPCTYGCNSLNGVYEVMVNVEVASGYEVVCLSNKYKEDGIYRAEDCYARFDSYDSGSRNFSFDYSNPELGYLINCNNVITHNYEDGNSKNGPSRDVCFADSTKWGDTPDTEVYVIMRKKGETLPKLDLSEKPQYVDNTTDITTRDLAVYSKVIFCDAGSQITLPIYLKNTATEVAGIQFKMSTNGTFVETTNEYALSERAGALDVATMNVAADSLWVAAYSSEVLKINGDDGDIIAVTINVPENVELGTNYDLSFTNVVLSTPEGKAVKCDDTKVSIIVGESLSIEPAEVAPKTGRIFRITGVEVMSADDPGLYIQDGKKFIVR